MVCREPAFFCLCPLPFSWDVIFILFYVGQLRPSNLLWQFQQLNDHFTYWWVLLWQLHTIKVTKSSLCPFLTSTPLTWKIFQLLSLPSTSYKDNQSIRKGFDSFWFFIGMELGKDVGGWGEVLSSSWVNLHWYRKIWADLFRISPLGENVEGSIQTTVLKQNEHLFHRHNYNWQRRKFFPNYLISEMGNKLVSLLGISTLVQWFIANLSMTQTHQIHQVLPFSHNKSLLRLWDQVSFVSCNICSSLSPVPNLGMCWRIEPWKMRIFILQVL